MDELHLEFPFAGSPDAARLLNREGIAIGRRACRDADEADADRGPYRKPNTSKPAPGHKIYPYLLRG